MALQIQITGPILTDAGEQFGGTLVNVEYILKCWKAGDNPAIAVPVIDKKFSGKCKTQVEGVTLDELVIRVEQEAIRQMQPVIDSYNRLQSIAAIPRIAQSAANIQTGLKG